jgi:hypothetical protein
MLGDLASNRIIGETQPCVLPSLKHPKTQRCQSVSTQPWHPRRLVAPQERDQYHEALDLVL